MSPFRRSSSYVRVDPLAAPLCGDGFVPERTLEEWKRNGQAAQDGPLWLVSEAGASEPVQYVMTEGLRVLGRRNGDSDPYGLTGRVLTLRQVLGRGALLGAEGMRLGASIYDVEFGMVAERIPPRATAHVPSQARPA